MSRGFSHYCRSPEHNPSCELGHARKTPELGVVGPGQISFLIQPDSKHLHLLPLQALLRPRRQKPLSLRPLRVLASRILCSRFATFALGPFHSPLCFHVWLVIRQIPSAELGANRFHWDHVPGSCLATGRIKDG